jgi:hypothetical protein
MTLTLHGTNGVTFPNGSTQAGATKVLQAVLHTITSQDSLSTVMPGDDTKPQITEGTQILTSGSITPGHANNIIHITIHVGDFSLGAGYPVLAIFDGSTDAVWAGYATLTTQIRTQVWTTTAGSTSARTYTVRLGPTGASACTINTSAHMGAGMGGEETTWMLLQEIAV